MGVTSLATRDFPFCVVLYLCPEYFSSLRLYRPPLPPLSLIPYLSRDVHLHIIVNFLLDFSDRSRSRSSCYQSRSLNHNQHMGASFGPAPFHAQPILNVGQPDSAAITLRSNSSQSIIFLLRLYWSWLGRRERHYSCNPHRPSRTISNQEASPDSSLSVSQAQTQSSALSCPDMVGFPSPYLYVSLHRCHLPPYCRQCGLVFT